MKTNTVINHIQLAGAAVGADEMPLEASPEVNHEEFQEIVGYNQNKHNSPERLYSLKQFIAALNNNRES